MRLQGNAPPRYASNYRSLLPYSGSLLHHSRSFSIEAAKERAVQVYQSL
jgi:hypothetical protein